MSHVGISNCFSLINIWYLQWHTEREVCCTTLEGFRGFQNSITALCKRCLLRCPQLCLQQRSPFDADFFSAAHAYKIKDSCYGRVDTHFNWANMLSGGGNICSYCSTVIALSNFCHTVCLEQKFLDAGTVTDWILEPPFEGEATETSFMFVTFRTSFGLTQGKKRGQTYSSFYLFWRNLMVHFKSLQSSSRKYVPLCGLNGSLLRAEILLWHISV